MALRQFTSTSDLLAKLTNDLTHAYPSFVQEFVGQPVDGVTLLLELLRTIQTSQASRRQWLADELCCLQCLMLCMRCPDTPRRLTISSAGLSTLTAGLMSNLNKSRILALQILRKVCEQSGGKGYGPVSDAMSTMRLKFGEPVRFRLLCGTLTSPGCPPLLLLAGLGFVNSFLEAAPSSQARLYVQAELEQAGFKPESMVKDLQSKGSCSEALKDELSRWQKLFLDVNRIKSKEGELTKEVTLLKDRINLLETRIQLLQEEKSIVARSETRLKSRCDLLEREVNSLRSVRSASTPAEDEGISSSGQEDVSLEREPIVYQVYHRNPTIVNKPKEDEETTIEEVMEEFQNIINDAESADYKDSREKKPRKVREETTLSRHYARFMQRACGAAPHEQCPTKNCPQPEESDEPEEKEIVPVRVGRGPPPPRRPPCPLYIDMSGGLGPRDGRYLFFEEEDEDLDEDQLHCQDTAPNSDSMLSGSEEHLYQEYYPIPGNRGAAA
ncbi:hypothetical protein AAG570_004549 [Ranatra chinensis]|uniref:GBD/FH3 domain-containing protein n=1 Tax=Ranatra chinensis TaxID=642074 RepID=A0ABD0Y1Z3_9HEMI